ncbi:hypothetical protein IFM89_035210 [Coptis chinensis]|uniref:HMA domain-containing protein n=1 Tax=Coptis chinensis TaxID=261450 RepID=A0A835IG95_9MAGN|nr:hypothetical protein IFM89_035210 [Coptis chinensis]
MGKLSFGRVLDCFCLSFGSNSSCFCINSLEKEDFVERRPLIETEENAKQTLAFQLRPKIVVLKVSMHCNGCARKVQKHISKMDGVTSFQVDLENKKVVVIGDILPFEVLESVSKVKNAEIWTSFAEDERNQPMTIN